MHARGLAELEEVALSGIFDINPSRDEALAQNYGGKVYNDLVELLKSPTIWAVHVLSHTDSHVDVLRPTCIRISAPHLSMLKTARPPSPRGDIAQALCSATESFLPEQGLQLMAQNIFSHVLCATTGEYKPLVVRALVGHLIECRNVSREPR